MVNLKSVLNEYKQHSLSYEALKIEHEKEQQELEVSNSRIKELEYQIASYEDWKEITKVRTKYLFEITKKKFLTIEITNPFTEYTRHG